MNAEREYKSPTITGGSRVEPICTYAPRTWYFFFFFSFLSSWRRDVEPEMREPGILLWGESGSLRIDEHAVLFGRAVWISFSSRTKIQLFVIDGKVRKFSKAISYICCKVLIQFLVAVKLEI